MTDNDKSLIEQAKHVHWEEMEKFRNWCETNEARGIITEMMRSGYHHDEAKCGMI